MAKAFIINASALTGRFAFGCITPRTLPWARSFCPFGAYHLSVFDTPTTFTSPLWYYRQQPFRRP